MKIVLYTRRTARASKNEKINIMIAKITKIYTRHYSDNGRTKTYVEFLDNKGKSGRTEGNASGLHMQALIQRGQREGVKHTTETIHTPTPLNFRLESRNGKPKIMP